MDGGAGKFHMFPVFMSLNYFIAESKFAAK